MEDRIDDIVISFALALLIFNVTFPVGEVAYTMSMYPTFKGGEAIILSPFLPSNLTNSIVVFKLYDGYNIVHRVISDNGTWIQTKGDNIPEPDPYRIPKKDVIGIVIITLPSYTLYKTVYTITVLAISIPYVTFKLKKAITRRRKHEART